jgi:hypothetical protein
VQSALSKSKNKGKAVNNNCGKKFWGGGPARSIISGLLVAAAALAVVYSEFEKERGKSLIGKKFKEQRVYCPR